MKRLYLSWLLNLTSLLIPLLLTAQGTLPKVNEINTTVSGDSLNSYVRILSGVDPVKIGGTTYTITSRKPGTTTQTAARNYIKMKFESFGLPTYEQPFTGTYSGTNVYAVQEGKNPNQIYIVCGHYDSVTDYAADDNGTGVAAVIETARILSKLMPEYTIVYAAWDREENGMVGSKYYAQQAKTAGKDIRAVINLDMLGWESNNDGLAEIHVQNYANSVQLANAMVSANSAYGIGLSPVIVNQGTTASDHSSFWNTGYSAILLIEGYFDGDFTPYYHKTTDRYTTLNLNYLYKMSKMAITTLAGYVMNDLYMLAGRVFEDEDALADGMVDGTGSNLGGLYIHLVDGTGKVTASAVVEADGSYTFPDVAGGSYTAQLTMTDGVVGAPMPATLLPTGWTYTGEHVGAGTGDDGQPNGLLTVNVTGTTNIREVRFGVGENLSYPNAPVSAGNQTICADEAIPALMVTVGSGETADWYAASTGGTALLSGSLSYTPPSAGTYYAQSRNTTSGLVSASRTAVILTINTLPTVFAGADRNIPYGTSTTINDATASGILPLTYAWTPATSFVNAALLNSTSVNLNSTNTYTLTVFDANGCHNSDQITIEVREMNTAPVLATIGNKAVNELTPLTFTATATDGDVPANTLTFSLTGAPAGATINPATGAFIWTPTEAQGPGTYTVTVQVCDNGTSSLCDTEEITITVSEVNSAPVLTAIGNKTVSELTPLTFTATATDGDVPANTLTFSLTGAPAGATINPTTGAFSWIPTEAQGPGTYTVTVQVCDNGTSSLCDTEEITITVGEVNTAPVLAAIGNKTVNEITPLTFTATATDGDVPANTLTFSLTGAPAGATINPTTGAFSWTPTEAQGPGTYTVTVQVCDNGTSSLCDTEEITISVGEENSAIYGNVFHDLDRMSDNTVDGSGINPAGLLYVNLLDATDKVLDSKLVNMDGTYNFFNVDAGNYTVQISVNRGVTGELMPLTVLPVNWIHTGENQGAGPGNDGTADGLLPIYVNGNSDLVQVNFGVVKLQDVTVNITASPNILNGVDDFDVVLKVTELNGVNTSGPITVYVLRDSRWTLKNGFDTALTFLGGSQLNNDKWTLNGTASDEYLEFVCNDVITGGNFITLGFRATFDPGATRGVFTITSQLLSGSGGENRNSNNSDAEKLDYFPE